MADFTSNFWSVLIAGVTLISIAALVYFVWVFSTRKSDSPDASPETMGHVWDENLEEYNNPLPRWWLNLFYITLFWGVGYLIFYPGLGAYEGVLGWSQTKQYEEEIQAAAEKYDPIFERFQQTPVDKLAGDADAVKVGERLFAAYCSTCHGSDARGARGFANLRDDDWLYGGAPEQIVATITNGRAGLMPPWKDLLSEDEINAVTKYVEHLAGRQVDSALVAEGKKPYSTYCVACHGPEGKGNQQLGAPNLTDDIWLHGGSTVKIAESIVKGRNGNMPPHGEFLGEAKVHVLAAYIYSFRNNAADGN